MSTSRQLRLLSVLFGILAFAVPHTARAQVPVPTDLQPGDTYHLIFNSSLSTTAFSTDIGFYNVVAQAAADVVGSRNRDAASF